MRWVSTSLLLLLTLPGAGQASIPGRKIITAVSVKKLDVPSFSYWGEPACDNEGNIYLHADTGGFRHSGVVMLTRSGTEGQLFQASGDYADTNRFSFENFAVSNDGDVYLLVGGEGKNYLLGFDDTGSMNSVVTLATPEKMVATDLVVLARGNVLVVGFFEENAPAPLRGRRYSAIFQSSGQLIKEVRGALPDIDVKAFASTVPEGGVVSGDDGQLYFLDGNEIVVASMLGEISRRISYRKPDPHALATKLYVSAGMAVIDLSVWKDGSLNERNFLTLDLGSGETTGLYAVPSLEKFGMDVCFDRKQGLTFLHHDGDKQTLITASLR